MSLIFADQPHPGQLMLMGLGAIVLGFVMWRSGSAWRMKSRLDPVKQAKNEIHSALNSPLGKLHEMEARLYDYGREVEARIENRMLALRHLIEEAQRQQAALESLLQQNREPASLELPRPPKAA